jgi:hypothetical protein
MHPEFFGSSHLQSAENYIFIIKFSYLDIQKYEKHKLNQMERTIGMKTIPKTQSHHSFVPLSRTELVMKMVSAVETH